MKIIKEWESIPSPSDGQIMYNNVSGTFKGYYKFNESDNTWYEITKEQAKKESKNY